MFNRTAMANLIPAYADGMDALIQVYGRSITLHFKPTIINITSDLSDPVRLDSERKPSYKTPNPPIVVPSTRNLSVLIKHGPKDYQNFGIRVDNPKNLIRIKSFLVDSADLQRCEYITIDNDSNGVLNGKYKALRLPTPFGLGVSRYALSYWDRV